MRITEGTLRRIIREELLAEIKIKYLMNDRARGVFDYWYRRLRENFQLINGRWPTYAEYAGLIEGSVPGFRYEYGANESPSDVVEDINYMKPGFEFLQSMYRQVMRFVGKDDERDTLVARAVERVGLRLLRDAQAIVKAKRIEQEAGRKISDEEYEASYKPKAPPDSPLGKYAFSPQRQGQPKPPPMEKNTRVESALLNSIINHFEGRRPLTRQQAELVIGFIRDGLYPDIFRKPRSGTYFRGMLLHVDDLKKMGIDITRIDPSFKKQELLGDFEIVPTGNRFSSSWSTSFSVAADFATRRGSLGTNMYAVVFTATKKDNQGKFLDAEGFYGVDLGSDFGGEKEVIGLGTIRANRVNLTRVI